MIYKEVCYNFEGTTYTLFRISVTSLQLVNPDICTVKVNGYINSTKADNNNKNNNSNNTRHFYRFLCMTYIKNACKCSLSQLVIYRHILFIHAYVYTRDLIKLLNDWIAIFFGMGSVCDTKRLAQCTSVKIVIIINTAVSIYDFFRW